MQFYVIGDESAVTGFGLAGVEGEVVETADEAREAIKKAFLSPDVGIIIVTEKIAA
jgi:vacuolar-type H+-ATPase subunit F/Vma7